MKVRIKEVIDYTLKRKGDRVYYLVDEQGAYIGKGGTWRTRTAARISLERNGFEYAGIFTVHQNYSHWAGWTPAKEAR